MDTTTMPLTRAKRIVGNDATGQRSCDSCGALNPVAWPVKAGDACPFCSGGRYC